MILTFCIYICIFETQWNNCVDHCFLSFVMLNEHKNWENFQCTFICCYIYLYMIVHMSYNFKSHVKLVSTTSFCICYQKFSHKIHYIVHDYIFKWKKVCFCIYTYLYHKSVWSRSIQVYTIYIHTHIHCVHTMPWI